MQVTVKDNELNVRVGKPSLNAPCNTFLTPGTVIDVDGQLYTGDFYNGINTWLKDSNNNYYWSGGVNDNADQELISVAYKNAQLAIDANESILIKNFQNIVKIYPSFVIDGDSKIQCVDICISDTNINGLPLSLIYNTDEGISFSVITRFITNFKNAKPQVGKGGFIANANSQGYLGTVGCILSSASNIGQLYLLTCNHVMTGGDFASPGNIGDPVKKLDFGVYTNIGTWLNGKMDNTMDVAIIGIDPTEPTDTNNVSLPIYSVTEKDCSITQVELVGAVSNTQQAYIIHINQPINVDYDNRTIEVDGLITLSIDLNSN